MPVPAGRLGRLALRHRRWPAGPAAPRPGARRTGKRPRRRGRRRRTPRRPPACVPRQPSPCRSSLLTTLRLARGLRELAARPRRQHPTGAAAPRVPTDEDAPLVLAKVEYLNPGGSVKDRIALRMVEAAEESGELQPGGTIVEPTSGNTGVGLAMVAQAKGYKCVFVCPDKVSEDKRNVLRAYGAEVVVCPTAVAPEHPDSYYNVSDRLVREIEDAWKPDQYSNPNNPRSHYETTGPGDLGADRGPDHALRHRHRHRRHHQRHRPVPQGAEPRRPGGRRRPGRLGLLRRHRAALPRRGRRRGLLARRPTTATSPTGSSRSPTPTRSR